jgi:hypothetical protein
VYYHLLSNHLTCVQNFIWNNVFFLWAICWITPMFIYQLGSLPFFMIKTTIYNLLLPIIILHCFALVVSIAYIKNTLLHALITCLNFLQQKCFNFWVLVKPPPSYCVLSKNGVFFYEIINKLLVHKQCD